MMAHRKKWVLDSVMSRKTVVIHIGMGKTGTTSIQESFYQFDNGKIKYGTVDNIDPPSNHSLPFLTMFCKDPHTLKGHRQRGRGRLEVEELAKEWKRKLRADLESDFEKLIYSCETLLYLNLDELRELKTFFDAFDVDIQIVGYARHPIGYANSALQQAIKTGTQVLHIPRPRYRRFRKFIEVFGRQAVTIRRFDRERFLNKSVVSDFCQLADLGPLDIQEVRVNDRCSFLAAKLIHTFNIHGPETFGSEEKEVARVKLRRLFVNCINGNRFALPEEFYFTRKTDIQDILWLRKIFGVDFSDAIIREEPLSPLDHFVKSLENISEADVVTLREFVVSRCGSAANNLTDPVELLTVLFEELLKYPELNATDLMYTPPNNGA